MTDERKNEIWAMLDDITQEWLKGLYQEILEDIADYADNGDKGMESKTKGQKKMLIHIFGKHNLTAQAEEKPTEPKFKVGDLVRINCFSNGMVWDAVMHNKIVTIQDYYVKNGVNMYVLKEGCRDFGEHCLEPYREPKDGQNPESKSSQSVNSLGNEYYSAYRLDLAKEIAKIMFGDSSTFHHSEVPEFAVNAANEIVKRLKETEE